MRSLLQPQMERDRRGWMGEVRHPKTIISKRGSGSCRRAGFCYAEGGAPGLVTEVSRKTFRALNSSEAELSTDVPRKPFRAASSSEAEENL